MCRHFNATIVYCLFISHSVHTSLHRLRSLFVLMRLFFSSTYSQASTLSQSIGFTSICLHFNQFAYCFAVAASFALCLFAYNFCRSGKQKYEKNAKLISRCLCGTVYDLCTVSCIVSICVHSILRAECFREKQCEQM